MFSQTVEYALRAVVYLADQNKPRTTQQIAEATKVPSAYLAKVMQELVRGGIIRSQRGLHGGCSLLMPREQLTIWHVVDIVEPIRRIRSCPLDLTSHQTRLCPLHKKMDDALANIEKVFKETTIADILSEPTTSKPLCPFPVSEMNGTVEPNPAIEPQLQTLDLRTGTN